VGREQFGIFATALALQGYIVLLAPAGIPAVCLILALSTAFWDAYLRNDVAARAWLDGAGPKSVFDGRDRWRKE